MAKKAKEESFRDKLKRDFKEVVTYPHSIEDVTEEERLVYQEFRNLLGAKSKKDGLSLSLPCTHIQKFAHSENGRSDIVFTMKHVDSGYAETGSLKSFKMDFSGAAQVSLLRSFLASRFVDENGQETTVFDYYAASKKSGRQMSPFFAYVFGECTMTFPEMRAFLFTSQVFFSGKGTDTLLVIVDASSFYNEMTSRIFDLVKADEQKKKSVFFPDRLVRKTGGANPVNISHLNTLSSGVRFALFGAPPQPGAKKAWRPLRVDSFFTALEKGPLRKKCENFVAFLIKNFDRSPNLELRQRRDSLFEEIVLVILNEAEKLRDIQEAWSEGSRLPYEQCLWLNPYRGMDNEDFNLDMKKLKWQKTVSAQFALWLATFCNSLAKGSIVMGDPEINGFTTGFLAKMESI